MNVYRVGCLEEKEEQEPEPEQDSPMVVEKKRDQERKVRCTLTFPVIVDAVRQRRSCLQLYVLFECRPLIPSPNQSNSIPSYID